MFFSVLFLIVYRYRLIGEFENYIFEMFYYATSSTDFKANRLYYLEESVGSSITGSDPLKRKKKIGGATQLLIEFNRPNKNIL